MAWWGIQDFIGDCLPLMYQSSLATTQNSMCLNTLTCLHHHWWYLCLVLSELLLELLTLLPNWYTCLLFCPVQISGSSVTFLKCSSDPTNLLPKIFQWLSISNSMKFKPLKMTHKFLCNRSSACLCRLISVGPLTLHTSSLHPEWFVIPGMYQGLVTLRHFTHQLPPPPTPISYPHAAFITWLTSIHPLGFSPDATSPWKMFCLTSHLRGW